MGNLRGMVNGFSLIFTMLLVVIMPVKAWNAPLVENPLMDFDTILFVGHLVPTGTQHIVDQYLGWNAVPGGGLFMITGVKKAASPTLVDVLKNSTVTNGRLKGKSLAGGTFLSPDLSFDGKTILFAWTNRTDTCYHIFKVNIDGTNLVQLTDGISADDGKVGTSHNDFDPCWLPNGRIVFISERVGGYGRCHPRHVPTYTLHSMKDDGTDIIPLSYHETNEWHPSVNNDGMIVYSRWDYLDRDDCIAHNLWTCYPDGRDPRAPHGNYPLPLTTMTGSNWRDGRFDRPSAELNIRAIPNSTKYVGTYCAHHGRAYGQLVLIDPAIRDDGKMSQVRGITTTQTTWPDGYQGPYATAWPLSEELFLCRKNNSIILRHINGQEEVIYTTNGSYMPLDPIPVKARKKPPVLPTLTWDGERSNLADHRNATISIMNVYYGDMPLPTGTKITALRIIQVIPQYTPLINEPRIGYASESLARICLGTVPVESDGSVYCEAPVGKEIYFQLIDDKGMAIQSMRAGAYAHPGEQLTCYGCHEDKWTATPPLPKTPLALLRAPSKLKPEAGAEANGVTPVNFYRLVKPVLNAKCQSCHSKDTNAANLSYAGLKNHAFWWPGPGTPYVNGDITTAKHGGSRTIPGLFGARIAPLSAKLKSTHHGVSLTAEEAARILLWLDCNSNELSAYTRVTEQKAGKLVWPEIYFDSANATGVERNYATAAAASGAGHSAAPCAEHGTIALRNCRTIRLAHPGTGAVRVRVFDYRGREIYGQIAAEPRISLSAGFSRGHYYIIISTLSNQTIKTMRILLM
jgi:hypothetical protein